MISVKKYLLNFKILKKNLNMISFKKLISSNDVLHTESKFIFACLNIAILEKSINK